MRLVAGSAARVTGVLTDANGEPMAGQVVNMDRITRTVGGALMSAGFGGTATTDARGAFEFSKLAAGEYNVYAGGQSDRVAVPVTLNDGEVRQVSLTPRRPTIVSGAIVTDDGKVPSFSAARLAIDPVGADPEIVLAAWGAPRAQPPKADWTFALANLDGPYLFRVNGLPDDWMLKAVTLGDRDLTDTPLTIARGAPEMRGLQVVISSRGAKVSGEVVGSPGTAGARRDGDRVRGGPRALEPVIALHQGRAARQRGAVFDRGTSARYLPRDRARGRRRGAVGGRGVPVRSGQGRGARRTC